MQLHPAEATETEKASDESDPPKDEKVLRYDSQSLRKANELRWELLMDQCMNALGKTNEMVQNDIKSADWKVLIVTVLKHKTSASNVWIVPGS